MSIENKICESLDYGDLMITFSEAKARIILLKLSLDFYVLLFSIINLTIHLINNLSI